MSNFIDKCLMDLYNRKCVKNFQYINIIKQLNIDLNQYKIIHIAGTNGKGSVSYKIANCLYSAGYKVGLFTSPHIWTPCERIIINNKIISNEDFIKYYNLVINLDNSKYIRMFEVFLIMALLYFIDNNVDWIILEVGIGGRLDSTNFIESTRLAVITSIGLDHVNILGESLNDIAYEKAGIIKRNSVAVIGPSCIKYHIFEDKCNQLDTKLIKVDIDAGDFDTENTEIARMALVQGLGIDSKIVEDGLRIKPPLRFYILSDDDKRNLDIPTSVDVIIDVAHNISGMEYIVRNLSCDLYKDRIKSCVYFNSEGRCLDVLMPLHDDFKDIYLASVDHSRISTNERLLSKLNTMNDCKLKEKLMNSLSKTGCYYATDAPNFNEIINYALKEIIETSGILLICGSFFAMVDVCNVFKIMPTTFGIDNDLPHVKY